MLTPEDKIRLIHDNHTVLLNRMFEDFSNAPGSSPEQVAIDVIVAAKTIQNALGGSDEIQHPPRGIFVLALQQVVDSFLAGLLTDDAFQWLSKQQNGRGDLNL
jgi:hypothetical protein